MQVKDILVFRVAAILGFINILLGSLGAHAIKFESAYHKELFDTGLLYQSIHIPVLLVMSLIAVRKQSMAMIGGLLGFTWPLFFKGATGIDLGPIVPTGGMVLMFAWIWLIFAVNPSKKEQSE
ncbi:MAG: DUF423 domain-containing protein [Lentisphaerales bacterium]|nr:DUF423 domain-containing protein [Lentisphaerales bacterium]